MDHGCALARFWFKLAENVSQVAEGGYTQTLKRSTDMEDTKNVPNEEQASRLQQPTVGGSAFHS